MHAHAPLIIDVAGHSLTTLDRQRLAHPLVGGVILFGRNWKDRAQLGALCRQCTAQTCKSRFQIGGVRHGGNRSVGIGANRCIVLNIGSGHTLMRMKAATVIESIETAWCVIAPSAFEIVIGQFDPSRRSCRYYIDGALCMSRIAGGVADIIGDGKTARRAGIDRQTAGNDLSADITIDIVRRNRPGIVVYLADIH